jgi:4-amino-4-deoxy-L-arabinose transferase-like glycosyltransferase
MNQRLSWWLAVASLGIFAYLYALGGMNIPSTGDEGPYLQITRLTAATNHWLPLQPSEGLGVTKPPLLFWHGLIASNWGQDWELWRFRLPIVAYTFLSALMVFLFTRRITGDTESAAIAGVAFLGFTSIFHHGRPYITNLPEVFFLSLTYFVFLIYKGNHLGRKYTFWIGLGVLVGLAAWVRSIFLIAPVGLALSIYLLWQRQWRIIDFIKNDAPRLTVFTITVLAVFGLWFVIDPNPEAIYREFLLGENVSKLKIDGYWSNFFSGPYPVFQVWFGIFRNAGFLALPLLYVFILSIKRWAEIKHEEKALWIWILAFIIVFTVPAQRQDSYVLATMPAVAVILGMHWREIPQAWFYIFVLPLLAIFIGMAYLMIPISQQVLPVGAYATWHYLVPFSGIGIALFSLTYKRWAPHLFIPLIFLAYLSLASVMAPFESALGHYDAATIKETSGKTVYVPTNFKSQYEHYHFLLPGAVIRSYDYDDDLTRDRLLSEGEIVVANFAPEERNFGPWQILGKRLALRNRMPEKDIKPVLFERHMSLLFRQELILKKPQQHF